MLKGYEAFKCAFANSMKDFNSGVILTFEFQFKN